MSTTSTRHINVLPDMPSSVAPEAWLINMEHGPQPQTPRLRPVDVRSNLQLKFSTPSPTYTPLSASPLYGFVDPGVDIESYAPHIQLAERARVVYSGKAIMVDYTNRRERVQQGTTSIFHEPRRGSLSARELRIDGYQEPEPYRRNSGVPEQNKGTLRRLRRSAGRPRVEAITRIGNNGITRAKGEGVHMWWQSAVIDGPRTMPTRALGTRLEDYNMGNQRSTGFMSMKQTFQGGKTIRLVFDESEDDASDSD